MCNFFSMFNKMIIETLSFITNTLMNTYKIFGVHIEYYPPAHGKSFSALVENIEPSFLLLIVRMKSKLDNSMCMSYVSDNWALIFEIKFHYFNTYPVVYCWIKWGTTISQNLYHDMSESIIPRFFTKTRINDRYNRFSQPSCLIFYWIAFAKWFRVLSCCPISDSFLSDCCWRF